MRQKAILGDGPKHSPGWAHRQETVLKLCRGRLPIGNSGRVGMSRNGSQRTGGVAAGFPKQVQWYFLAPCGIALVAHARHPCTDLGLWADPVSERLTMDSFAMPFAVTFGSTTFGGTVLGGAARHRIIGKGMTRWKLALMLLLLPLCLASPAVAQDGAEEVGARFGDLRVLLGTAVVTREGKEILLRKGSTFPVVVGDTVQTLEESKVHIEMWAKLLGSEVVLSSNSRMQLHELRQGVQRSPYGLLFGALRARVQRFFGGQPLVGTPTAVIGVKGTDFVARTADDGRDQVLGIEGTVAFASREAPATVVLVTRRELATLIPGTPVQPPVRVSEEVFEQTLETFSFPREVFDQQFLGLMGGGSMLIILALEFYAFRRRRG